MIEFSPWPKTPRLFRDIVITEKIDGTNAAVVIDEDGTVAAQSRSRLIGTAEDNHGFARWVSDNADGLYDTLGPGHHFGEWWGSGIQRGYDLPKGEKRFSLFNVNRHGEADLSDVPGLGVVPVLYAGPNDTFAVNTTMDFLQITGSHAAPGFMRPEGVIVFHTAARTIYKVLIENDEIPKGMAKAEAIVPEPLLVNA